jgi:hypothetical protein
MIGPATDSSFNYRNDHDWCSLLATKILLFGALLWPLLASALTPPVATYNFQNTLTADEPGPPALVPVDPLTLNGFETTTVFGETRVVYRFDGNSSPNSEQAGLILDTSTLLSTDLFSIEVVIEFFDKAGEWRRIIDVSNRQTDSGLYINPSDKLDVYPTGNGPTTWTNNVFHQVVITNDGSGTVSAYMDGIFQFDLSSASLDLSNFSVQNPGRFLHLFVDNVAAGGQGEFSDGRIALLRLFDYELSPTEVDNLHQSPLQVPLATYSVGGNVSGLTGSVTLQNNGGDDIIKTTNDGFTFPAQADSSVYAVTVSSQPTGQTCTVIDGSGTISAADVADVGVTCVNDVIPPIDPPAPAVPIPTLSQWVLIMLSMLFGLMVISNRKRLF